jgi:hypothetical protein
MTLPASPDSIRPVTRADYRGVSVLSPRVITVRAAAGEHGGRCPGPAGAVRTAASPARGVSACGRPSSRETRRGAPTQCPPKMIKALICDFSVRVPPIRVATPSVMPPRGPTQTMTRSVTYDPASPQRPRPNHVDHDVLVHFESIQTHKNLVINTVAWCTTTTTTNTHPGFGAPAQDPTPASSA